MAISTSTASLSDPFHSGATKKEQYDLRHSTDSMFGTVQATSITTNSNPQFILEVPVHTGNVNNFNEREYALALLHAWDSSAWGSSCAMFVGNFTPDTTKYWFALTTIEEHQFNRRFDNRVVIYSGPSTSLLQTQYDRVGDFSTVRIRLVLVYLVDLM